MNRTVLYIHGRGGSPQESRHYEPLFPGCQVLGLDYQGETPWEAAGEIRRAVEEHRGSGELVLVANSIGAYFCLHAGITELVRKAYFISPIVDMERVILGMMAAEGVSQQELREKGEIGELSWKYLSWVRSHPIRWRVPTEILYGDRDTLTSYETVSAFAKTWGASLTVMKGGEHWFHTEEQLAFLDQWIERGETLVETRRLKLYPASREQMEAVIAAERAPELRKAYGEMLEGGLAHPRQWAWYAMWRIERRDGTQVGDLCFKGLGPEGVAEIGYGILEDHQGQGYATEAVQAVCRWAFRNQAKALEAETEPDNAASQRVLEKCGFVPSGTVGEEGPRFVLMR